MSIFFSMLGSRAVWHKDWKAVTMHPTIFGLDTFVHDCWELYNTDADPCEMHDLAAQNPAKVQEMVDLWFYAARQFKGLPIEDRSACAIRCIFLSAHPQPSMAPHGTNPADLNRTGCPCPKARRCCIASKN